MVGGGGERGGGGGVSCVGFNGFVWGGSDVGFVFFFFFFFFFSRVCWDGARKLEITPRDFANYLRYLELRTHLPRQWGGVFFFFALFIIL